MIYSICATLSLIYTIRQAYLWRKLYFETKQILNDALQVAEKFHIICNLDKETIKLLKEVCELQADTRTKILMAKPHEN